MMDDKSRIICLTGFMGCGKSSVGRELARRLGWRFTDLDEYIVRREGRSIPEIFRDGESAFRKAELAALREYLDSETEESVLSLGGGTFTIEAARILTLSKTSTFFLRTRLETIRKRLGEADVSRPLFADAEQLYSCRLKYYEMAEHVVDTDELDPGQVAENIIDILSS